MTFCCLHLYSNVSSNYKPQFSAKRVKLIKMKQAIVEERKLVNYLYKNGKILNKIAEIINRKRNSIQYLSKRYNKCDRVSNELRTRIKKGNTRDNQ